MGDFATVLNLYNLSPCHEVPSIECFLKCFLGRTSLGSTVLGFMFVLE